MSRWRRRACGFWLSGHYDWVLERNRQAHQAAFFERQMTNWCPISGKLNVIHGLPTIFTSSPIFARDSIWVTAYPIYSGDLELSA